MPMLDISKVSETLKTLVERHVEASLAVLYPGGATDIGFSLDPPDRVSNTGRGPGTISLYLYHLSENEHYKNLPASGRDQPPIRYTPMGLDLFYQLTAHAETTAKEQTLMGLAVKALRDYPIIDDSTDFGGLILNGDLRNRDNRIRIDLQPIPDKEAVGFWTAGTSPLRLAAYYKVSIALLEPEETQRRTGRVLSYDVYAYPISGSPRLDYSMNPLFYDFPGELQPRQLEVRPAQVPYVSDTLPAGQANLPKNGDIAFYGSELSGGRTTLLLKSARWEKAIEVDGNWGLTVAKDRVGATVQKTIGTGAQAVDILPGPHTAFVRRVLVRPVSLGGVNREPEQLSNQTPFLITPRIDGVSGAGRTDRAAAVDVTGWIFDYTDPNDSNYSLDVQVYLGGERLALTQSDPPGQGEFAVIDPSTLRLVRSADIQAAPNQQVPLRIFVNGAEAQPLWLETP